MRIEVLRGDAPAFAIEGPESGPMALAAVSPWAEPFARAWWAEREPTTFGDTGTILVGGGDVTAGDGRFGVSASAAWKRALCLGPYGLTARIARRDGLPPLTESVDAGVGRDGNGGMATRSGGGGCVRFAESGDVGGDIAALIEDFDPGQARGADGRFVPADASGASVMTATTIPDPELSASAKSTALHPPPSTVAKEDAARDPRVVGLARTIRRALTAAIDDVSVKAGRKAGVLRAAFRAGIKAARGRGLDAREKLAARSAMKDLLRMGVAGAIGYSLHPTEAAIAMAVVEKVANSLGTEMRLAFWRESADGTATAVDSDARDSVARAMVDRPDPRDVDAVLDLLAEEWGDDGDGDGDGDGGGGGMPDGMPDWLARLCESEPESAAGDQPRDERGRWEREGGGRTDEPTSVPTAKKNVFAEIMRRTAEEHARLTRDVGDAVVAVLRKPDDQFGRKTILHPSTKGGGVWQVSEVDARGPIGHYEAESKEKALRQIAIERRGMIVEETRRPGQPASRETSRLLEMAEDQPRDDNGRWAVDPSGIAKSMADAGTAHAARQKRIADAMGRLPDGHVVKSARKGNWTLTNLGKEHRLWVDEKGTMGLSHRQLLNRIGFDAIKPHVGDVAGKPGEPPPAGSLETPAISAPAAARPRVAYDPNWASTEGTTTVREYNARMKAYVEARADQYEADMGNATVAGFRSPSRPGETMLLHPSTKGGGVWQMTHVLAQVGPAGHDEFPDRRTALDSLAHEDWEVDPGKLRESGEWDGPGRWITVGSTNVFVRDGEDPADSFKRLTGKPIEETEHKDLPDGGITEDLVPRSAIQFRVDGPDAAGELLRRHAGGDIPDATFAVAAADWIGRQGMTDLANPNYAPRLFAAIPPEYGKAVVEKLTEKFVSGGGDMDRVRYLLQNGMMRAVPEDARQEIVERLSGPLLKAYPDGPPSAFAMSLGAYDDRLAENPHELRKHLISSWAGSSRSLGAQLYQHAVREEFRASAPLWFDRREPEADAKAISAMSPKVVAATRELVREMRGNTRRHLEAKYPDGKVRLMRGVKGAVTTPSVLESWTTDEDVARRFDGHAVMEREVPIDDVLVSADAPDWHGRTDEAEYIVVNGPRKADGGKP